jgi:hypothetical protein
MGGKGFAHEGLAMGGAGFDDGRLVGGRSVSVHRVMSPSREDGNCNGDGERERAVSRRPGSRRSTCYRAGIAEGFT